MSHSVIYKVQVIIFFARAGDNWHFNASCKGSPRLTFPNNIHHPHHSSQKWVGRFCKNLNIIKEQRQLLVIGKAWGCDSKLTRVVSIGAQPTLTWCRPRWRRWWPLWRWGSHSACGWSCRTPLAWALGVFSPTGKYTGHLNLKTKAETKWNGWWVVNGWHLVSFLLVCPYLF